MEARERNPPVLCKPMNGKGLPDRDLAVKEMEKIEGLPLDREIRLSRHKQDELDDWGSR